MAATNGHIGSWQTLAELDTHQAWTERFSQLFELNYFADVGDPANGKRNSAAQGASILSAFILNRKMTLHTRGEWLQILRDRGQPFPERMVKLPQA
jgi:hypothetical protein